MYIKLNKTHGCVMLHDLKTAEVILNYKGTRESVMELLTHLASFSQAALQSIEYGETDIQIMGSSEFNYIPLPSMKDDDDE